MKVLALSGIGTKTCLAHFTRLVSDSTAKAFGVPLKINSQKGSLVKCKYFRKIFLQRNNRCNTSS